MASSENPAPDTPGFIHGEQARPLVLRLRETYGTGMPKGPGVTQRTASILIEVDEVARVGKSALSPRADVNRPNVAATGHLNLGQKSYWLSDGVV